MNNYLERGEREKEKESVSEIEDVVDLHVIWWMSREREKEREREREREREKKGQYTRAKVCLEGGEAADM